VVGRNPDLVLATSQVNSGEEVEPLRQAGIPVEFLEFSSVADVIEAIREVGELLGTAQTADSAADFLDDRWNGLRQAAASVENPPSLLMIIGYDVVYAFGSESYTEEMIAAAGATSITADLSGQSSVLSDEFVLSSAPEIIVITSDSTVSRDQILSHHPSWDAVPAIAAGHIYTVDPDLVLRPGPRVVEGTERLASIVATFEGRTN
jgi:iron complex transport system substrate-binding protein